MPTFFTTAIFTVNTCDRNIFTVKANCRENFYNWPSRTFCSLRLEILKLCFAFLWTKL